MLGLPIVGCVSVLVIAGLVPLGAQGTAAWKDPSPHTVSFVSVDTDVRLEVLDWGGSGRTLVLLTGLGDNAHVFDEFAPKLSRDYHVLGITRRGFGASTIPASGYDANRLGDDVLAALDSLHLEKPVLVGHSIAGEELSSVGSRYPQRVAGLIYLEAAYPYAFENGKGPSMAEFRRDQSALPPQPSPTSADNASYTAAVDFWARTRGVRLPEAMFRQARPPNPDGTPGTPRSSAKVRKMVQDGSTRFSSINVPVLAVCAMPQVSRRDLHDSPDPNVRAAIAAYDAYSNATKEKQLTTFEEGIPHARVVRIPNADHYIFVTNEAEVLQQMRTFLSTLK